MAAPGNKQGAGGRRGTGPSITDVAREASVSIATVSRVLNTPDLVAAETAERVHEAIRSLGYRPNMFAKGLVTRRSRVIGISLPDIHGEFYSELMQSADEYARELGYHLLVGSTAHWRNGEPNAGFALDLIDGLVSMPVGNPEEDLESLVGSGTPIVVLGRDAGDLPIGSIAFDNTSGAREATLHLLGATAPGDCFHVGGPRGNVDSDERAKVFCETLRASGWTVRDDQVADGEFSVEWGWSWASSMLDKGRLKGAAVLAGNDEIAIGVLDAARDNGLRVPDDVRVVGFDDSRLCTLVRPMLSSVHMPIRQAGRKAIDAVVSQIENEDCDPKRLRLMTSLVVRQSSSFIDQTARRKGAKQ